MQAIERADLERMNETTKRDFILVNVLPRDQFNQRHIRTSVNVPLGSDDFLDTMERVAGSREREIVVYCASSECDASQKAARRLDQAGFSHVYDYEGGTEDWLKHH